MSAGSLSNMGLIVAGLVLALFGGSAVATPLWYDQTGEVSENNGVFFPQGVDSFADSVIDYSLGGGGVTAPHTNPNQALGAPNYDGQPNCANHSDPFNDCTFVSLGSDGSLTLKFETNALTGSGDDSIDLWVFEVGPLVEPTLVDISADGMNWFNVGQTSGATSGVDLDAFGFGPGDEFQYVRLTDLCAQGPSGACTGRTAGADITAVGAISTVLRDPQPVPAPTPLALILAGLAGLGLRRRSA